MTLLPSKTVKYIDNLLDRSTEELVAELVNRLDLTNPNTFRMFTTKPADDIETLKNLLAYPTVQQNPDATRKLREVLDFTEMVNNRDVAGLRCMLNRVKDSPQMCGFVARTLNQLR